MVAADLVEIFSSVQGEGPEVGASTLFVRFGGCDLRCRWCDSPHTWRPGPECRIERARGSGSFDAVANPVSVEDAVAAAEKLELTAHRFVSLTGGEPLLQPEAAAALAAALGGRGPALHLETHGAAAPESLEPLLPHLTVVSMDWKLASDVHRAGASPAERGAPFHEAHQRFLARARDGARVVVKLVVTPASEDDELDEAFARIAATAPEACVVLQPVTPAGGVKQRPTAQRLLAVAARAEQRLADVRIIPQTHPVFGAL